MRALLVVLASLMALSLRAEELESPARAQDIVARRMAAPHPSAKATIDPGVQTRLSVSTNSDASDTNQLAKTERDLAEFEGELLEMKRQGKTRWHGAAWLKSPEYYRGLDTIALARECFTSSPAGPAVFSMEAGLYGRAVLGLKDLEVNHDGFNELFHRDDLWRGALAVEYDLGRGLANAQDLRTVIQNSDALSCLGALRVLPQFAVQVKGREELFLAARLEALEGYITFLQNDGTNRVGCAVPFYGDATGAARGALDLVKEVDPVKYAHVQSQLSEIPVPPEQRMEYVQRYIETVLVGLKDCVSTETTRKLQDIVSGGAKSNASPEEATLGMDVLCRAAGEVYGKHTGAIIAGKEKMPTNASSYEIPSTYWTEPITALHPIKVYTHRVNIVVVQNTDGDVEEGKYIYIMLSSYLPRTGDDGFEFTPSSKSGNGVFDFRRTRSK